VAGRPNDNGRLISFSLRCQDETETRLDRRYLGKQIRVRLYRTDYRSVLGLIPTFGAENGTLSHDSLQNILTSKKQIDLPPRADGVGSSDETAPQGVFATYYRS
jgi:hypothetical protein